MESIWLPFSEPFLAPLYLSYSAILRAAHSSPSTPQQDGLNLGDFVPPTAFPHPVFPPSLSCCSIHAGGPSSWSSQAQGHLGTVVTAISLAVTINYNVRKKTSIVRSNQNHNLASAE